jgi:hypothetical protein
MRGNERRRAHALLRRFAGWVWALSRAATTATHLLRDSGGW